MKKKSVVDEAADIRRAVEMVELGARMQMLEAETSLSREKLLRIPESVFDDPGNFPMPQP